MLSQSFEILQLREMQLHIIAIFICMQRECDTLGALIEVSGPETMTVMQLNSRIC